MIESENPFLYNLFFSIIKNNYMKISKPFLTEMVRGAAGRNVKTLNIVPPNSTTLTKCFVRKFYLLSNEL